MRLPQIVLCTFLWCARLPPSFCEFASTMNWCYVMLRRSRLLTSAAPPLLDDEALHASPVSGRREACKSAGSEGPAARREPAAYVGARRAHGDAMHRAPFRIRDFAEVRSRRDAARLQDRAANSANRDRVGGRGSRTHKNRVGGRRLRATRESLALSTKATRKDPRGEPAA